MYLWLTRKLLFERACRLPCDTVNLMHAGHRRYVTEPIAIWGCIEVDASEYDRYEAIQLQSTLGPLTQLMASKVVFMPDLEVQLWPALQSLRSQVDV